MRDAVKDRDRRECLDLHRTCVDEAVLVSVKLFPNLAAALKGVFNRVVTTLYLHVNGIGDGMTWCHEHDAVLDAVKDRSDLSMALRRSRRSDTAFVRCISIP